MRVDYNSDWGLAGQGSPGRCDRAGRVSQKRIFLLVVETPRRWFTGSQKKKITLYK